MVDDFQHGGQVALFLEFARVDADEIEKFIGVDQVEVTGKGQVAGRDGISFDERVAEFDIIPALGAIAEMAQEEFPQEADMAFHEAGVLGNIRLVLFQFFDLSHDLGEDIGDGLVIAAADPM